MNSKPDVSHCVTPSPLLCQRVLCGRKGLRR